MTKSTKFNLSRYQELLTKTNSSKKEGKEYFQDPEVLELLSCQSSVQTQIFYDQKNEYFDLIQKYLSEKITPNVFRGKFIIMTKDNIKKASKILQNFEELSTFWIEPDLDKFSSLFEAMYETCLYAFEFEDQDGAMPEDQFRNSIQKTFLQMEKYFDNR